MRHLSAHKAEQEAVQEAYDRGVQDTLAAMRDWLTERGHLREFATVKAVFETDWCEPAEQRGKAVSG